MTTSQLYCKTLAAMKILLQNQQPTKTVDVRGADRHQFFRRPIVPFMHPVLPAVRFDGGLSSSSRRPPKCTRSTQTDYRESETQTTPWAPPYTVRSETDPEVLSLAMLSWGKGLPAGVHEVEIIERARVKRAWESSLPPMEDAASIEKRRKIVEAMERDEWVFREREIQTINDLRMELAQKLLEDTQRALSAKLTKRLNQYWQVRNQEKEEKLKKIRDVKNRAIRKLTMQHAGINKKYHKENVVDEHNSFCSELYGPQLRFGENPKRGHEVINIESRLLTRMRGLEILESTSPKRAPAFDFIKASMPKQTDFLCVRETRWTEEVLQKLHEDLKAYRLRKSQKRTTLGLVVKRPTPVPRAVTPSFEGTPDWEEEVYQSSVFLQKIIKGRAIQSLMFRERDKCRELIEELKSTHALIQSGIDAHNEERVVLMLQQRKRAVEKFEDGCIMEMVKGMEGQTVSTLLDFLSKELWRLQDERRAHAFAMLAERERYRREAAEAGRRQAEERRRREHDEMFKQVVKVHQDTVDLYLEDIIVESMNWVAEAEARLYIKEVVKTIDQAAHEAHHRGNAIEEEELVADLINNFVVPEVQKEMVRKKIKARQEKYLRAAHEAIYNKLDPMKHQLPTKTPVDAAATSGEQDMENVAVEEEEREELEEEEGLEETIAEVEDDEVDKEPEVYMQEEVEVEDWWEAQERETIQDQLEETIQDQEGENIQDQEVQGEFSVRAEDELEEKSDNHLSTDTSEDEDN
ncbi:cilia- and flagella-associated protein 91-like [Anabrus simplex]|uniref:cilia- and flagella-associated protein 91-like n=1 Tax=Anabrus simplex TaxID=316456 RepID=UPI0035A3C762